MCKQTKSMHLKESNDLIFERDRGRKTQRGNDLVYYNFKNNKIIIKDTL